MKCKNVRLKLQGKDNMLYGTLELVDNSYNLRLIEDLTIGDRVKAVASATIDHPDEAAITVGKMALAACGIRQHPSQTTRSFDDHIKQKKEEATSVYWGCIIDKSVSAYYYQNDATIKLMIKGNQNDILFPSSREAKRFYKKIDAITKGKHPWIW